MNMPLRSGCGTASGNGPSPRAGSPVGGSTLVTSAPRSPSSLAAYGPATPCARSSTRRPESGCWLKPGAPEPLVVDDEPVRKSSRVSQDVRENFFGHIHSLGTAEVIRPLNDGVDDDGIGDAPRFGQQRRLLEAAGVADHDGVPKG